MTLILMERTGAWSGAIHRKEGALIAVRQTRSPTECRSELVAAPLALVAVEWTPANTTEILSLAEHMERRHPSAMLVALAAPSLSDGANLLIEAGVRRIFWSLCEATALVALYQRRTARLPPPRASLAEQIWAALPWSE